jgi:hypothetical protein
MDQTIKPSAQSKYIQSGKALASKTPVQKKGFN